MPAQTQPTRTGEVGENFQIPIRITPRPTKDDANSLPPLETLPIATEAPWDSLKAKIEESLAEAKQEAAAAVDFAEQSPVPTVESIMDDVYWETDNNTEASKIGQHFFND